MKIRFLTMAAVCFVLAASLTAGNISLGDISEEAVWFSHFDVEKFNNSELRSVAEANGLSNKCAKVEQHLGFDPSKTIKGVTLYGTSPSPKDACVIMRGDFNADELIELASEQKGYSTTEYGEFVIHKWQSRKNHVKTGCFYDGSTLIMSRSSNAITSAIDALEGQTPGISTEDCMVSSDAIMQIFISDASYLAQKAPRLVFLENVGQTLIAVGQKEDDLFCEFIMQTDTDKNSELLVDMLEGIVAMAKMKAAQKENVLVTEAMDKVAVSREGKTVITTMVLNSAQFNQVVDMLRGDNKLLSKVRGHLMQK